MYKSGTNTRKYIQRKAAKRRSGSSSRAGTLKAKLPFNYLRANSASVIYHKTSWTLSTIH